MKKIKLILPLIIVASTAFPIISATSCNKNKDNGNGSGTTVESLGAYTLEHKLSIGKGQDFSTVPKNDPSVASFMSKNITKQAILNWWVYWSFNFLITESIESVSWEVKNYNFDLNGVISGGDTFEVKVSDISNVKGAISYKQEVFYNGNPEGYDTVTNATPISAEIGTVDGVQRVTVYTTGGEGNRDHFSLMPQDFNVTFKPSNQNLNYLI